MQNFEIQFTNAWLLLLLIPAIGFTLLSYYRLAKRYRRTRNRITSMVLHMLVMCLSVFVLAGMTFHYEVPNEKNEILLVVDVSETEEQAAKNRDKFVERVLSDGRYGNYKIGVVTFGFDQEYAVPMTYKVNKIYDAYLDAERPDTSATDIASALEFARDIFKNPQTGKIVLVTDGKQTDREAQEVIRTITAQGTKIDVAHVPSSYEGTDVYVQSVDFPEYHINTKEECKITLNIDSNEAKKVSIAMLDNGEEVFTQSEIELSVGEQKVELQYAFETEGLHEMSFAVSVSDDVLQQNNEYTSYYYLDVFDKLLIVERESGQSEALLEMLGEEFDITVKLVYDTNEKTGMPKTVDELRVYDQVILNNIANEDMPQGFDVILESYVRDYGGGLFTTGGKKEGEDGALIANAYRESDMYGSLYQDMLPVEVMQYTPPMGLVVIVDRSGSMGATDNYGNTYLQWAKTAMLSCLNILSERDYISVLTLDDDQDVILPMTPRTQDTVIRDAIQAIDVSSASGGTVYPNAINRAGQALLNETRVARKHIILISDGGVNEEEMGICEKMLKTFYEEEITFSFVGVAMAQADPNYAMIEKLTIAGHGNMIVGTDSKILNDIRKELVVTKVASMNDDKEFTPVIMDTSSPLVKGLSLETDKSKFGAKLYGYHGVKARATADIILRGEYNVPIYAQWKYGAGTVGSFMCDLQSSSWSKEFMTSSQGSTFIKRVINNLMPSQDIRVKNISYSLTENNYTNELSVFAKLEKGQAIKASIYTTEKGVVSQTAISMNVKTSSDEKTLREAACYVTLPIALENNYSRCDFVVKKGGVYKIVLQIVNADGTPIVDANGVVISDNVVEFYKSFAYSQEYLPTQEETEAEATQLVASIAERAQGAVIENHEDPVEVFNGFVTALSESFDPRWLFMILAIVFFLTDIAVRKFKFKWPHEIIRAYREKKKNSNKDSNG